MDFGLWLDKHSIIFKQPIKFFAASELMGICWFQTQFRFILQIVIEKKPLNAQKTPKNYVTNIEMIDL